MPALSGHAAPDRLSADASTRDIPAIFVGAMDPDNGGEPSLARHAATRDNETGIHLRRRTPALARRVERRGGVRLRRARDS
ncbi:hypothetical protein BURK1_02362 [Burkholderiales bacterium]|nr:hypothetical protein BURK1_02362 [Burkholderiales bacterium]